MIAMTTPEITNEEPQIKRDFGEVEFRIKCMFCNAEDNNAKEYMGYTWEKSWTCPHCGITYRLGKSFWGSTRCLFMEMDQGSESMFQKTAEWEKNGHEYKDEPKNFCAFCPKALKFEEVQRIEIMMNLGGNFAKMTVPVCKECKEKKAWRQSIPTISPKKSTKKYLTKAESRRLQNKK